MNKKSLGLILSFVLVMLSTSPVHSQSPAYTAIPYVPDGAPTQVLDIYLPETGDSPFPTVFEIPDGHGHGTPGGQKHMLSHLLEQGYAFVAVHYDYSDYSQGVKDSFCALAWLHTKGAEYNLDTTRTVAVGFSGAGLIVSLLGTVDEPAMFLADCPYTIDDQPPLRGVIDLSGGGIWEGTPDDWLSYFTGVSIEEVAALRESITQIPASEWADTLTGDEKEFASRTVTYWLDGSEPPFLLAHSENNCVIHESESIRFAEALEAVGSPVELLLVSDISHIHPVGLTFPPGAEKITETVDAFLKDVFQTDDVIDRQ